MRAATSPHVQVIGPRFLCMKCHRDCAVVDMLASACTNEPHPHWHVACPLCTPSGHALCVWYHLEHLYTPIVPGERRGIT